MNRAVRVTQGTGHVLVDGNRDPGFDRDTEPSSGGARSLSIAAASVSPKSRGIGSWISST